MNTSLFELFKIGIGPSSSHTVGPMRAAHRFVRGLESKHLLDRTASVNVDLYGSLALTGIGHGTDRAILLGLLGEAPDTIDPAAIDRKLTDIRATGELKLGGHRTIPFTERESLHLRRDQMYPDANVVSHPNGMRFTAFDASNVSIVDEVYYSIGGGFIVTEAERTAETSTSRRTVPHPFRSAAELLATAEQHNLTIANLVLANETALLNGDEGKVRAGILKLWQTMQTCTRRGIETEGILPGGLNVRRRAPRLARRLETEGSKDPLAPMDWVTVWAMAVNEENAAGGRVVTAPTNGAAGVIPAIGHYYMRFIEGAESKKQEGILRYFLTAAAIGILYKENASISGAEVGCQGEVGVACSMAAGGLVAALGGTNAQVEHAAEIAMEHNLGMTCDPIGGLVQIPCIERNGMGAVKAINAARMSMHETTGHKLSLDQIIATMYQTGLDMQSRYKETSLAGLALNIIEC
ncbi:L-serine ammonia-lyase [Edaphobacter sp.]|uniref:L-serine ammonia-lyase n=1 Tax=Edaphobacter sp. TaxID=1934404 RepID=UPI002DC03B7D|nr:L-serine ammonia-lyase [Edaphobacter sp.]HEU5340137.1 L-serine ammonia-lyase [Edaphobacter sp.]